jgi:RNA polymerase sigma factor (sigma-70 family)
MVLSRTKSEQGFYEFVKTVEPGLSRALVAAYGPEVGHEAARDALAYAWEHWARVARMKNPVGYLYRVGQSSSRRYRRRAPLFPATETSSLPHVEPKLPQALGALSERQRAALTLIHVEGLSEREAAKAMGISRVTLRRHADRALLKLREILEVTDVD